MQLRQILFWIFKTLLLRAVDRRYDVFARNIFMGAAALQSSGGVHRRGTALFPVLSKHCVLNPVTSDSSRYYYASNIVSSGLSWLSHHKQKCSFMAHIAVVVCRPAEP